MARSYATVLSLSQVSAEAQVGLSQIPGGGTPAPPSGAGGDAALPEIWDAPPKKWHLTALPSLW